MGKALEIEITLRKANPEDLSYIIDLACESIIYSISPFRNTDTGKAKENRRNDLRDIQEWLSPNPYGLVLVAETEKGEICGHVILSMGYFGITEDLMGWILDITVAPCFRGTGLSQKIHNLVEIILKDKNVRALCLGVTSSNIRAVNFYKRLGYEEEYIQMVKVL
ncbi:MAG TPA: GNAT family N-acetyltransferase [Candidatus Eremiobacteraeota bacterium]|nr:MAG: putative acetyltransferase [bacterium ADurb.Bin363]HPZ07483.1 GNAT family N-acetyltransferase [Candidatus Eremiobacteraeota bacterium]